MKPLLAFLFLIFGSNVAMADCTNQPPLKQAEIEFYAEKLGRAYAKEDLEKEAALAFEERGRKLGLDESRMECVQEKVVDAVRVQKGEPQVLTTEPLTAEELALVKAHWDVLEPMANVYESIFGVQTPQGRMLLPPKRQAAPPQPAND